MPADPQTAPRPKLTARQAEAIKYLEANPAGRWQGFGGGVGRLNVALRGLLYRAPDFISCMVDDEGNEKWILRSNRTDLS